MKNLIQIMLLCCLLGVAHDSHATAVRFMNGDLLAAKSQAKKEGKMVLVDFYAKWCMPCKWMDQTTFSDPQIGQIMNNEFVSVKINIDDLEGFNLSQQYEIQVLPTILIFNSDGTMVDRVEETMAPSKMLDLLNKHRHGQVSNAVTHTTNRSPRSNPSPRATPQSTQETKAYYRLQMGVYSEYEQAARKVASLQDMFLEPIVVINQVQDNEVYFKIMMGHFTSHSEAESFKTILKKDFGLDSLVR